ncbi:MAG TPA: outer membrane beta-barrel protein [Bacteroidales bacterium]|nr:hypothetical protein [Bacteroidales bacterium]HOU96935.1 outer membrane beta-barrel protein [Bacteroidales bacterium]
MKTKSMFFVISFIGLGLNLSAQEYAIDKKATIVSGYASFMNKGGDLFEDSDGNNSTTFNFTPTVNYFIIKNLFAGVGIELSTDSQGDYNSNSFGIGPQIGYAFGNSQSNVFPYLDLGIRYYKMNIDYGADDDFKISGSDLYLSFGVIVPVKTHIGLIFEGGYHMMDLKNKDADDSVSGNIFSIGIGISGLLF